MIVTSQKLMKWEYCICMEKLKKFYFALFTSHCMLPCTTWNCIFACSLVVCSSMELADMISFFTWWHNWHLRQCIKSGNKSSCHWKGFVWWIDEPFVIKSFLSYYWEIVVGYILLEISSVSNDYLDQDMPFQPAPKFWWEYSLCILLAWQYLSIIMNAFLKVTSNPQIQSAHNHFLSAENVACNKPTSIDLLCHCCSFQNSSHQKGSIRETWNQ